MATKVMFDVDGVLADFVGGYRRLQEKLGQKPTSGTRWDDYWDKAVWSYIKQSPSFWYELPLLATEEEMAAINDLQDQADVYFVTAKPGFNAHQQTCRWLEKHGIYRPTVILSQHKAEIAKALEAHYSIEDKAGNAIMIAYHAPKCRSYLLDNEYNRFDHNVIGKRVVRVGTVGEFVREIE